MANDELYWKNEARCYKSFCFLLALVTIVSVVRLLTYEFASKQIPGVILASSEQYEDLAQTARQQIAQSSPAILPSHAWMILAYANAMLGKEEEAEKAYEQARQVDPKGFASLSHFRRYVEMVYDRGQYEKAKEMFEGAIAAQSEGSSAARVYVTYAKLLATSRHKEFRNGPRAKELAQQAVEMTNEKSDEAFDALAAAEAQCGEFEMAIAHLQRAIIIAQSYSHITFSEITYQERLRSLELYSHGVANREPFLRRPK